MCARPGLSEGGPRGSVGAGPVTSASALRVSPQDSTPRQGFAITDSACAVLQGAPSELCPLFTTGALKGGQGQQLVVCLCLHPGGVLELLGTTVFQGCMSSCTCL